MSTPSSLDHQTARTATSIRMPTLMKGQIDHYADRIGMPINSAMILLLDRSLQAAGYPGISGRSPSVIAPDVS